MENDGKGNYPVTKLFDPDESEERAFDTQSWPSQKIDRPSMLKNIG